MSRLYTDILVIFIMVLISYSFGGFNEVLAQEEQDANKIFSKEVQKAHKKLKQGRTAFEKNEITRDEYISQLHECLQVPDIQLIILTASELKQFGDKKATSVLGELFLNGETDKLRSEALSALRQIGDESVTPYTIELLKRNNEADFRYENALLLLTMFGDKSAVPHIKKKLFHENVYVRRRAALALHKLGDQTGVPIMIASLKSKSKSTRSVANAVLREITGQDFAEGKSLRRLLPEKQNEVIEKWLTWWKQNKNRKQADDITSFAKVLEGEAAARARRYATMKKAQKDNPDLPTFDDPKNSPEAVFEEFKAALRANDFEKLISCFASPVRAQHTEIYRQLRPYFREMAEDMGEIIFQSQDENMLRYEIIREEDDGLYGYPINFVMDFDGNWKILDF